EPLEHLDDVAGLDRLAELRRRLERVLRVRARALPVLPPALRRGRHPDPGDEHAERDRERCEPRGHSNLLSRAASPLRPFKPSGWALPASWFSETRGVGLSGPRRGIPRQPFDRREP